MNAEYKPTNYNTVSPYLILNGADATIGSLKRVFRAVELRRFADESGTLIHAAVQRCRRHDMVDCHKGRIGHRDPRQRLYQPTA
jgi:hypothetical protein